MTAANTKLDDEFPFRKYERECDEGILQNAWKRLLVDPDHLANLAEQMGDPAIAHTMSLWAANKSDPELTKLKDACALKHAPKTSWKKLCIPKYGGGPDKFRGYMMDKIDDADRTVACIARKCFTFFSLLEKRYTSLLSTKKHSAHKLEGQRDEMMYLVYHGCKYMKRRARKPAARHEMESKLFEDMFGADFQMAIAKSLADISPIPSEQRPSSSHGPVRHHDEQKRGQEEPSQPPLKSARVDKGAGGKGMSKKQEAIKAMEAALTKKVQAQTRAKDLQRWIDEQFEAGGETRSAIGSVMSRTCRNCLLAGRGIVNHSRADCERAGNPPFEACPECLKKGEYNYHWRSQCPNK